MSSVNQVNELMVDTVLSDSFLDQHIPSAYDQPSQECRFSQGYRVAKRVIDICGALVGLTILSLFLPVLALLIFWQDRGPIFYKQTRIGLQGQVFSMYKIRTMVVDADLYLAKHPELQRAWHKTGKLREDPRITKLGRFMRRTSIDELPQFFNVLRGEMSLVGPRAIQNSEVSVFGELFNLRQMVKPGITGLWQISGRSTTDYTQRCILDCTYVLDCSFSMDIYILLKTIPTILYGIGAY